MGTKVKGDTLPRPILIGHPDFPEAILSDGYAMVGLFSEDGLPTWWVGER